MLFRSACVYAREFPAQAMLRMRPELRTKPVAVLDGEPPAEFVCSANEPAYVLGVQRGMTRPQLEVLEKLELLRRTTAEEQSARTALLECAQKFSPRVEELRFEGAQGFCADLSGTQRLLGSTDEIAGNLLRQAAAVGITISVATSCNFHTALCWAKSHAGTKVIAAGEERKTLAPIPIEVLELTLEQSVTLSLWGIHTLGALAALANRTGCTHGAGRKAAAPTGVRDPSAPVETAGRGLRIARRDRIRGGSGIAGVSDVCARHDAGATGGAGGVASAGAG